MVPTTVYIHASVDVIIHTIFQKLYFPQKAETLLYVIF